jgi:hypothetical protein
MPKPPAPCAADLAFEPNDTLQMPFSTAIGVGTPSVTYPTLLICSATDVDIFKLQTSTTTNLEAVATLSTPDQLSLRLLNVAGSTLAVGVRSNNQVIATVGNASAGIYYVQVVGVVELSYHLVITAAP